MAIVNYIVTITGGQNTDKKNRDTVSGRISRSGDAPPSGSTLLNSQATKVGPIRTYTSNGLSLEIGAYGKTGGLYSDQGSHTQNNVAFLAKESIQSVSNEAITVIVHSNNSGNAINFRSGCRIEIQVEYKVNTPPPPPVSASTVLTNASASGIDAGQSVTVSISNSNIGLVSHKVTYSIGSNSYVQNLGVGVSSAKYSIPLTWLNAIPSAQTGTVTVGQDTYYQGSYLGRNTTTFTLKVPANINPTIGSVTAQRVDNTVPASWGIYVQDKSGVTLIANNCTGIYGSTIQSYTYSANGSNIASVAASSYKINRITDSGEITYVVTIRDSRGRTAQKSVSINVEVYTPPVLTESIAYRCQANGEANEDGTYIGARSKCAVSSCGGNNRLQMFKAYYKDSDHQDWIFGGDVNTEDPPKDIVFGNGAIDVKRTYQVKFTAQDTFGVIEKVIDVSIALYTMSFKRGGQSVGFGMEPTLNSAVQINGEWSLYVGDINIIEKIKALEKSIRDLGGTVS